MEEVKVGVFLSDCHNQISEILNFEELINYAENIPNVVYTTRNKEFTLEEGVGLILEAVKAKGLNRVIVSACDSITSMIRIRRILQDIGINPYYVDVINLREHCAWPHRDDASGATEKAKAMLLSAVEKIKLQEPIETLDFPVKESALVIGGGIAGIQAAIDLTDLGFQVNLVEREPILGGISAKAGRFFPTDDCSLCIQSPSCDLKGITHTSRKCLYRSGFSEIPNLNVFTNSRVVEVNGGPGNYKVTVETGKTSTSGIVKFYPPIYSSEIVQTKEEKENIDLNVGTIVVATGFEEFDSSIIKEYNYGVYPEVITQLELAEILDPFGPTGGTLLRLSDKNEVKKIVMIQCVGSRDQRYKSYCSSICCMIALKHSLMIKERYPDVDVNICYIDIRSWGRGHEDYYEKARKDGVKFVKGRPTEITRNLITNKLVVDVEDALLGEFLELEADLVILSTAFVPSKGTKELAKLLGLELSEDGFLKEYNAKLRPTETKLRGIYLCGGATFPKDAPTTSIHSSSAALKAAKFMRTGKFIKDGTTAEIDSELCGNCEFCPVVCPFEAISLEEVEENHFVAKIDDLRCEACGICVGTCPKNAIELKGLKEDQIMAQIKSLVQNNKGLEPPVLAFSCAECGFAAVDAAGMASAKFPSNVRILKVPCTGILKIHHFLEAFQAGADGVMVVGCKTDGCHYEEGSLKAAYKVKLAKKLMELYGIEPDRLEMFNITSIEGKEFAEEAKVMVKHAKTLGPIQRIII
jgi:heterodisulfide reductase subunit A